MVMYDKIVKAAFEMKYSKFLMFGTVPKKI